MTFVPVRLGPRRGEGVNSRFFMQQIVLPIYQSKNTPPNEGAKGRGGSPERIGLGDTCLVAIGTTYLSGFVLRRIKRSCYPAVVREARKTFVFVPVFPLPLHRTVPFLSQFLRLRTAPFSVTQEDEANSAEIGTPVE